MYRAIGPSKIELTEHISISTRAIYYGLTGCSNRFPRRIHSHHTGRHDICLGAAPSSLYSGLLSYAGWGQAGLMDGL